MPKLLRNFLISFAAGAVLLFFVFANAGITKSTGELIWIDNISEMSCVVFALIWGILILGSRPSGRISVFFTIGLCAFALGSWADFLDELFFIEKIAKWDNMLESGLIFSGMLAFSVGLYLLREEQLFLSEHMLKRERVFREHRSFDRIAHLGNADYLRKQLQLEKERAPNSACSLILLDLDNYHQITREHGLAEGDRVLQAAIHLLLLNMRTQDLLCRYAGNRLAILLPETGLDCAAQFATHFENAIKQLAHHTLRDRQRLTLSAQSAYALCEDSDVEALLSGLNAALNDREALPAFQPSV